LNFSIDLSQYTIRQAIDVNGLVLKINYNNTNHIMKATEINSNLPMNPVLVTDSESDVNNIIATYTGTIPTGDNLNFEIPIQTTLGNDTMSVIDVSAELQGLNCLVINDAFTESYLEGCNLANTLLNISVNTNGFRMNGPNPAEDVLKVKYELPFENNISIEIYSSYGQKVKTVSLPSSKQGINEVDIDITDLTIGTYIAKYKSYSFVKNIKLK
jgi:hypothetical protein